MFGQRSTPARRRKVRIDQDRRQQTRVSCLEVLECRWLLAIDLSADLASASAVSSTPLFYPTARVFRPLGDAQPHGSAGPVGMQPSQIAHAYGFDQILFGAITGTGAGQTIAIVDAYDTPTILHDLLAFDAAFGIPDPPSFIRVAQDGSTNYPPVDPAGPGGNNWEVETALDVEWAHALAPQANILLVEAANNGSALWTAVEFARNYPGVSVISMSYGGSESIRNDPLYTTPAGHTPITFVASTGDDGVPGGYPALSPNVVAIGGTTLTLDGSNNITNETGWSGSGGGISQFETQPSYQTGVVTQSNVWRTIPDVSFDANPSTGAAIYDSYNNGTATPWTKIGGTSFSAPSWAALIAIANQGRALNGLSTLDGRSGTLPALYSLPSADFRDITSGNNGAAAGVGYDLVTGRGSPRANLVANGLVTTSTISGTVFSDDNNNGVLDSGENGLAGWTVYDDLNNNGVLDPPAVSTINSNFSPALAIPDGSSSVTSTLTVGDLHGSIIDINVNLTIHHTRDSNITVTLISPSGTSVSLISHNGSTGANFLNTTLDDQSATAISSGTATFTGSYRPVGSLASLIGQNPQGVWQLVVADTVAGNTGVLDNWSLQILTPSEPSVTTGGDGVYDFANASVGTHHIRDIVAPGFTQSAPASGLRDVTVAAGVNPAGQDFAEQDSTVSGQIFLDSDADGVLDPGEVNLIWYVYDDLNNNGAYDSTSKWTVNSSDVAKSILDQSTIISTNTVTGLSGAITDLNVSLTIHHTRDSNLAVTLISPDGTYVPLINHNGGNGVNFISTTLDDQASTAITSGTAPFTNSYRPSSVLSALNGKSPNGVWKLMVVDTVTGNTGTLDNWSLSFTTSAAEPLMQTDNTGAYQVTDLNAGTHHIRSLPISNMTMSAPPGGAYNVTVSSLTTAINDNFGFVSSIITNNGGPYTIGEGSPLTLNGSASGGTAPYTYSWDVNGDGIYDDAVGPNPTLTWSQLTALGINNGPSTFNVRMLVLDSNDGVAVSVPTTLMVTNVAPTANAGGPYTIDEGSPLSLVGTGTDPVDSVSYSWDLNGDGTFGDATGANPTLTWNQLTALGINNGPGSFNVKLRVDDGQGGVTISAAAALTVNNVAPTANAGGPYAIDEGSPLTLAGTGTDPVDSLGYSWDVNGDGVFGDATGDSPTLTWSQLVALGINNGPGAFNIKLRVNDGDGGVTDSTAVTLTVNNVAPTANAGGPYTIDEGSPLSLTGIGTDPVDSLTYSWDVNGDGVFGDATGANPTLTWAQLTALGINNGPGAFNVKLRVNDGDGGVTTSLATALTVNNVAPTADAGGPYTIDEGSPLSLTGIGTDPADSLTYSWDVNGDGVFGDATGANPTLTWSQLTALGINNGPSAFNVKLRVNDGDGGVTTSLATALTVNNVAPTADAGGPYTVSEGGTLHLAGVGADPADSVTYAWDINDDGIFGEVVGASPTLTWTQLEALGIDNGPSSHSVTLRVTDADGSVTVSAAATVTVNNAPPAAGISGPTIALRSQAQTYTLTAADAAPSDQFGTMTFAIDWGDGSAVQIVSGGSGTQVAHAFNATGPLTVSVTATDQDGGVSAPTTLGVHVDAVQTRPNVQNPALLDLVWGGTAGDDHIALEQVNATTIRIRELQLNGAATNNVQEFTNITGRVIAYGGAGNDQLDASALATTQATLNGGAGNNTLHGGSAGDILIGGSNGGEGQQGSNVIVAGNGNNTIYGNDVTGAEGSTGGNNLIIGGAGSDTIYGSYGSVVKKNGQPSLASSGGQNLIVGGGGADTIYASQMADGAEGGHGSILIAGSTSLGPTALQSILNEWTSASTYSTKIANIEGLGSGPNNNGTNYLQPGVTVFNDLAIDQLYSDTKGNLNWLLLTVGSDSANRAKASETKTNT